MWLVNILGDLFGFDALFDNSVPSKRADPEEAICRIINLGVLEGHDQKVIGGTGDAA